MKIEQKKYRNEHKTEANIKARAKYHSQKNMLICHCGGHINISHKSSKKAHYNTNRHKNFNTLISHSPLAL